MVNAKPDAAALTRDARIFRAPCSLYHPRLIEKSREGWAARGARRGPDLSVLFESERKRGRARAPDSRHRRRRHDRRLSTAPGISSSHERCAQFSSSRPRCRSSNRSPIEWWRRERNRFLSQPRRLVAASYRPSPDLGLLGSRRGNYSTPSPGSARRMISIGSRTGARPPLLIWSSGAPRGGRGVAAGAAAMPAVIRPAQSMCAPAMRTRC